MCTTPATKCKCCCTAAAFSAGRTKYTGYTYYVLKRCRLALPSSTIEPCPLCSRRHRKSVIISACKLHCLRCVLVQWNCSCTATAFYDVLRRNYTLQLWCASDKVNYGSNNNITARSRMCLHACVPKRKRAYQYGWQCVHGRVGQMYAAAYTSAGRVASRELH